MRILAFDRFKNGFAAGAVQESTLTAIQEQADVISMHVPLTDLTHEMLNTAFFQRLKKKPLLINTARGQLLKLPDLIQALDSGAIRGAALDVLPNESLQHFSVIENEQLVSLASLDNVLLTPHIAGYSYESFERMATVLLEKLGLPIVF